LLSHQKATNLQELVGLLAGKLVGVPYGLQLALCALSGTLQPLQIAGVIAQSFLLIFLAS